MLEIFTLGNNFERILLGFLVTLKISLISIIFSVILGVIFGVIMSAKNVVIWGIFRVYLEAIRIVPPLVWLFLVFFGLPQFSTFSPSGEMSAIIVFVAWGSIEMADLVRGSILSLPKHQVESALSLGMSAKAVNIYIILPQITARILPLAINLATRIIKTTSIIPLIGVVEVLKTGQQIIEASILEIPDAPFWVYGLIFCLYFIACYPLSLLSAHLERKYRY